MRRSFRIRPGSPYSSAGTSESSMAKSLFALTASRFCEWRISGEWLHRGWGSRSRSYGGRTPWAGCLCRRGCGPHRALPAGPSKHGPSLCQATAICGSERILDSPCHSEASRGESGSAWTYRTSCEVSLDVDTLEGASKGKVQHGHIFCWNRPNGNILSHQPSEPGLARMPPSHTLKTVPASLQVGPTWRPCAPLLRRVTLQESRDPHA